MGTTNLRIDDDLHDAIRALAKKNRRSVTKEINALLEIALRPPVVRLPKEPPFDASNCPECSSTMWTMPHLNGNGFFRTCSNATCKSHFTTQRGDAPKEPL